MTETLTPSQEIVQAAGALRAAAEDATPGPWSASPVYSPDSHSSSAVYTYAGPPGTEVIGSTPRNRRKNNAQYGGIWRPRDAVYIAVMNPIVGQAVADWLDHVLAESPRHLRLSPPDGWGCGCLDCEGSDALIVARAINGGASNAVQTA